MSRKLLSLEEQETLSQNPNVKNVTEKSVTYTDEFREKFYNEYITGKLPTQILRDHGFDIAILGRERIKNLTARIKKFSQREEGFKDTRKTNSGRPCTKGVSIEEQLDRLKHQNALLKQENEFLKKVEQIERRAEQNMRLQAKNSN